MFEPAAFPPAIFSQPITEDAVVTLRQGCPIEKTDICSGRGQQRTANEQRRAGQEKRRSFQIKTAAFHCSTPPGKVPKFQFKGYVTPTVPN